MTDHTSLDANYFACPHCGADLPNSASFCRHCGASSDSGWNDDEQASEDYEGGYADDEDFDYERFVTREFGERTSQSTSRVGTRWLTGIIVAIVGVSLLVWTVLTMH